MSRVLILALVIHCALNQITDEQLELLSGGNVYHQVTGEDIKNLKDQQDEEFISELKIFYKPETEVVISVSDLEYLIRKNVLTHEQASELWETLLKKAENEKSTRISTQGFYQADDQMLFGIISVLTLFYGIGSYIVAFIFLKIVEYCYVEKSQKTLLIIAPIFSVIFYLSGYTLHHSQGSDTIAGGLFLLHMCANGLIVHCLWVIAGFCEFEFNFVSALMQNNLRAKALITLMMVLNSYYISLLCSSPLVQIPFYLGITYIVNQFSTILDRTAPAALQPYYAYSMFGYFVLLFGYLHYDETPFITPVVQELIKIEKNRVDFRFMGYITSLVVSTWSLNHIVFYNYYGMAEGENTDDIWKKYQDDRERMSDYRPWQLRDLLILILVLFQVGVVLYGYRLELWIIIFSGQVLLQFALTKLPVAEYLIPDLFIFPIAHFFLIVSSSALTQTSEFNPPEQTVSLIWYFSLFAMRLCSIFLGLFSLCSSHILVTKVPVPSEEEKQQEILYDDNGLESLGKFFMCYIISLFLLILAEQETSFIISTAYSLCAIIIYRQTLQYTTVTRTNYERVVVNAVVFLSGMRISLIAKDLYLVFFMALIMMTLAIYRLYECAKYCRELLFFALVGIFLLLFHAFCLKSGVALIVAVFLIFVTMGAEVNKVRIFLFSLVIFVLYVYFSMDFVILFETLEGELSKIGILDGVVETMRDPSFLIPEKALLSDLIEGTTRWLLTLSS